MTNSYIMIIEYYTGDASLSVDLGPMVGTATWRPRMLCTATLILKKSTEGQKTGASAKKKKHKVPIFDLPESFVGLLRVRISAVWISGYLEGPGVDPLQLLSHHLNFLSWCQNMKPNSSQTAVDIVVGLNRSAPWARIKVSCEPKVSTHTWGSCLMCFYRNLAWALPSPNWLLLRAG